MNEMDSAGVGIVEMCITGYLMELWVTMFAGRGKAALCFSMCCEHSYPQLHKTGSYTHSHNAYACGIHLIHSFFITFRHCVQK